MHRYERLWERLLAYLSEWATVREGAAGLELTFVPPGGPERTVVLVLTEDDWDTYVSVIFGTGDPRATPLRQQVLAMPNDAGYLVYDAGEYDWVPSTTGALPEDEDDAVGITAEGRGRWYPGPPPG